MSRFQFALRYLLGHPPWDTNQSPPELIQVIETEKLPAGQALELGCGTGTNVVYMAQHGWQVTGIDFVRQAIFKARRKARKAKVADSTKFVVGDVTRLDTYGLRPFDFVLDLGCMHGLDAQQQIAYAEGVGSLTRPGAIYLLYAFKPGQEGFGPIGIQPDDVRQLFDPYFETVAIEHGDSTIPGRGSAWYRLQRLA